MTRASFASIYNNTPIADREILEMVIVSCAAGHDEDENERESPCATSIPQSLVALARSSREEEEPRATITRYAFNEIMIHWLTGFFRSSIGYTIYRDYEAIYVYLTILNFPLDSYVLAFFFSEDASNFMVCKKKFVGSVLVV